MNNLQEFHHILVIEDQKSRRIVSLHENTYAIGRDPNSTIPLYDRQVSRHHATLLRTVDYKNNHCFYRIIDGNLQGKRSTNGIVINGKQSFSYELQPGDLIKFGSQSKASYYVVSSLEDIENLKMGNPPKKLPEVTSVLNYDEGIKNTIIFDNKIEKEIEISSEKPSYLSQSEYNPYPIIEIDSDGKITYLNSAANIKFPDIEKVKLDHPIFKGIFPESQAQDGTSFVREIQVDQSVFEQHTYYLSENQITRIYLFEITKRKQLEAALKNIKEKYRLFIEQSSEGIFWVDPKTKKILAANPAYCHLIGYNPEEMLELTLGEIIAIEPEALDNKLEEILGKKQYWIEESQHRCENGSLVSVEVNVSLDSYQGEEVFCFIIRDISERKRSQEILNYQLLHDHLTDLPNRKLFNQEISIALANAQKNQTLMAVMFLDLDCFKNINNTLGHTIGDQLLQIFAKRLSSCLRSDDTVARWGGDEFTIVLPTIKSTEDTVKLAQKILDSLKHPFDVEEHQFHVKTSIGIALYPQDGEDSETLLKNSDTALSRAKEQGRNQYQFYTPGMTSEASLLLKLETLLQQALEKHEFSLSYQPQIKVKTGEIVAMEALLRWHNRELSSVPPHKFIPLAEKTDLIIHIGKWVLKTACAQNQAWQAAGLPPFPVTVNLSARQFQQANLAEMVAQILEETGLAPHWLELEVAETTILENVNFASKTLQDLQKIGVHIAMDDFCTGYASLNSLKKLPIHTLKIDQSFVRDLRGNPQDVAIISAVIALGRGFNLRVVAEGVETQQQLDLLFGLQCEEMQGYWFSRPLKTEDATQFLIQRCPIKV